jgi:murein DD-endopeptidase MepM/ murein hydrolase activator NlpD
MYERLVQGGAELSQPFGCTHVGLEMACPPGCDHWHGGWDLAAPCGRQVYSNCSGRIVAMGDDPGYGRWALFVQRDGDGAFELYGHLLDAAVRPGDRVREGQPIGHVGTEGHSTGCHLHFAVHPPWDRFAECAALDPAPFFGTCPGSGVRPAVQPAGAMPLSGLAVLLLLDPGGGRIISSPAAPGLGITWEP